MRVRITGRQRVHYEQVIEIPAGEFARLIALDTDKFEKEMQHRFTQAGVKKTEPIEDIEGEPVPADTPVTDPERDVWGEDPKYTRNGWRQEVEDRDTNLGYWDWVDHQREASEGEFSELEESDEH